MGQEFDREQGIRRPLRSLQSDVRRLESSASRLPSVPTEEINKARDWIDKMEGAKDTVDSLKQDLDTILSGRFDEETKNTALDLWKAANSLLGNLDDEISRAQQFINNNQGPTPAPDPR